MSHQLRTACLVGPVLAGLLVFSAACDNDASTSSGGSGSGAPASSSEHHGETTRPSERTTTHPTSHTTTTHPTTPTSSGHFDPNKCPAGLTC